MRLSSLTTLALAFGLFTSAAAFAADEVAPVVATGTVTGKVVDKDNKPVADATVMLKLQVDKPAAPKKEKGVAAEGDAKPEAHKKAAAPLSAKTGADGAFSIANVPAGIYMVGARGTDVYGKAAAPVTVKGGDTVDAGTITLAPRPAKKNAN